MKLLIIGAGRHGKDTTAELLAKHYGIGFSSSSWYCAKAFLFEELKEEFNYSTISECFEDRANHRALWKRKITEYNSPNKNRLAKEILAKNDMYVGMRCPLELKASRDLFDHILFVDAAERLPPDPSMGIIEEPSFIHIDNNGTLSDLENQIIQLGEYLKW